MWISDSFFFHFLFHSFLSLFLAVRSNAFIILLDSKRNIPKVLQLFLNNWLRNCCGCGFQTLFSFIFYFTHFYLFSLRFGQTLLLFCWTPKGTFPRSSKYF